MTQFQAGDYARCTLPHSTVEGATLFSRVTRVHKAFGGGQIVDMVWVNGVSHTMFSKYLEPATEQEFVTAQAAFLLLKGREP